jgi:hypothetical protein
MLFGDSEGVKKLPDSLQASKDSILSSKGIFSEENLECCFILMLAIEEVRVRAGELIKVVKEHISLILEVVSHLLLIN